MSYIFTYVLLQENLESHLENKTRETFAEPSLHVVLPLCLDLNMDSLHIPLYIAMTAMVTISFLALCSRMISTVSLPRACIRVRE